MPRFSPSTKNSYRAPSAFACVDLHVHSDASDGSHSVRQLIKKALDAGLRSISFTDHDTVEGTCEALLETPIPSLDILSGIELSAQHVSGGMHILGYLFDPHAPSLTKTLALLQNARVTRNLKMVKNLQALGIEISYEEIEAIAVRGQVGRPHFAQALVEKRVIRTVEEAFHKFLRSGRPGHAPKFRLSSAETMQTILEAGGVPVLAHPASLQIHRESDLEKLLLDLRKEGLKGLEVYYTDHSTRQQMMYEHLADRCGLVKTGGTDFHGETKPGTYLGVGKGDLRIPYRLVEALREAHLEFSKG